MIHILENLSVRRPVQSEQELEEEQRLCEEYDKLRTQIWEEMSDNWFAGGSGGFMGAILEERGAPQDPELRRIWYEAHQLPKNPSPEELLEHWITHNVRTALLLHAHGKEYLTVKLTGADDTSIELDQLPSYCIYPLTTRYKGWAGLDVFERRVPQGPGFFGAVAHGRRFEVRVETLTPEDGTESVKLTILPFREGGR